MLSDIQQTVRQIVAQLPEAADFALAGGAALIVSGVVDRLTKDLDFFTPYPNPVEPLARAAETALESAGLEVTTIRSSDTYAQMRISSGSDATNIDLASDYRMMDAKPTDAGFVLDVQELAADKVLALEARGVPRDYIDFAALHSRYSVEQMCQLAAQKDTGFDPTRLASRLSRFFDLNPTVFRLDQGRYAEVQSAITTALADLGGTSTTQQREGRTGRPRGREQGRGPDIGL